MGVWADSDLLGALKARGHPNLVFNDTLMLSHNREGWPLRPCLLPRLLFLTVVLIMILIRKSIY